MRKPLLDENDWGGKPKRREAKRRENMNKRKENYRKKTNLYIHKISRAKKSVKRIREKVKADQLPKSLALSRILYGALLFPYFLKYKKENRITENAFTLFLLVPMFKLCTTHRLDKLKLMHINTIYKNLTLLTDLGLVEKFQINKNTLAFSHTLKGKEEYDRMKSYVYRIVREANKKEIDEKYEG